MNLHVFAVLIEKLDASLTGACLLLQVELTLVDKFSEGRSVTLSTEVVLAIDLACIGSSIDRRGSHGFGILLIILHVIVNFLFNVIALLIVLDLLFQT